jgi:hypothetical protein
MVRHPAAVPGGGQRQDGGPDGFYEQISGESLTIILSSYIMTQIGRLFSARSMRVESYGEDLRPSVEEILQSSHEIRLRHLCVRKRAEDDLVENSSVSSGIVVRCLELGRTAETCAFAPRGGPSPKYRTSCTLNSRSSVLSFANADFARIESRNDCYKAIHRLKLGFFGEMIESRGCGISSAAPSASRSPLRFPNLLSCRPLDSVFL